MAPPNPSQYEPYPIYNTTFIAHALSPIYHGSNVRSSSSKHGHTRPSPPPSSAAKHEPRSSNSTTTHYDPTLFDPAVLNNHATRLRNLLKGDILRGVHVGLEATGGDETLAKAGSLLECSWTVLGSEEEWYRNQRHRGGVESEKRTRVQNVSDTREGAGEGEGRDRDREQEGEGQMDESPSTRHANIEPRERDEHEHEHEHEHGNTGDNDNIPIPSIYGILIDLRYERATYKAILLGKRRPPPASTQIPNSTSASTPGQQDIPHVPLPGFTHLPLLLTRMPSALRRVLLEYLASAFDTRAVLMNIPSDKLCEYMERFFADAGIVPDVPEDRDSNPASADPASIETNMRLVKDALVSLRFASPIAPLLKSLNVTISQKDIGGFVKSGQRIISSPSTSTSPVQDNQDTQSRKRKRTSPVPTPASKPQSQTQSHKHEYKHSPGPFMSALSAYTSAHLALPLPLPLPAPLSGVNQPQQQQQQHHIHKVACASFVLAHDGRVKFLSPFPAPVPLPLRSLYPTASSVSSGPASRRISASASIEPGSSVPSTPTTATPASASASASASSSVRHAPGRVGVEHGRDGRFGRSGSRTRSARKREAQGQAQPAGPGPGPGPDADILSRVHGRAMLNLVGALIVLAGSKTEGPD